MATVVKKTISLPIELAKEVERIALEERTSFSAIIQEAIKLIRKERLKRDFYQLQGYWTQRAKELGILEEEDLKRYLKK